MRDRFFEPSGKPRTFAFIEGRKELAREREREAPVKTPARTSRRASGQEIEAPMAVVILAGLATSTLLNLFVLPTLALGFGRFEKVAAE